MPSAQRWEKALTCTQELCQSPPARAPGFPHLTHFGLSALEMTTPSQATYFFLYNEYKPQRWTAKKSRPTSATSCVTSDRSLALSVPQVPHLQKGLKTYPMPSPGTTEALQWNEAHEGM